MASDTTRKYGHGEKSFPAEPDTMQGMLWQRGPLGIANPLFVASDIWLHRELVLRLVSLSVSRRYKGSLLGLLWPFVSPLLTILIYTFAFSVVVKVRWPGQALGSHAEFALAMFSGLVIYSVFSETVLAAPDLILSRPSLVKKVLFPLRMLPLVGVGEALVHSVFALAVLLVMTVAITGGIPGTVLLAPLIFIPLVLLCLGLSWFLASAGVFVRDLSHLLQAVVHLLFFLTPIFYPLSAVPEKVRWVLYLNPLTYLVTSFRELILWQGRAPAWGGLLILTAACLLICLAGYAWFAHTRADFSDVV
ncbi:MAG: ABC transporter permease [Deltaproteobacteria bacterium]|nr:ABC transporter permease [Deltaproteobacteria bacterium]